MYIVDLNTENLDITNPPFYTVMELPCPNYYDYNNYNQDYHQDYHKDSSPRLPSSS